MADENEVILNEDFQPSHIAYISTVLQRLGVMQLTIYFSGSGDSGGVEDWNIKGPTTDALHKMPVTDELITVYADAVPNGEKLAAKYTGRWGNPAVNMLQWLGDWCSDHGGSEPYVMFDYYNNDGGGGTCTIYPGEMRWVTEGYEYETVRQDVPSEEGQADFTDFVIK